MVRKLRGFVGVSRYLFPVLLRGTAIALVLVTTAWFVGTYVDLSPGHKYGANSLRVQPLWLRSQIYYERVFVGEQCSDRCAQVRIQFHEVDFAKQQVNWTIQVVIPNALQRRLAVGYDYVAEPDPENPDQLILREQFRTRDLPLTLKVHGEFPNKGNDAEFQIPLTGLFSVDSAENTSVISMSLQPLLYGRPRLFPSDWYSVDLGFSVALPTGLVAWNEDGTSFGLGLPFELWVASDVGMSGKELFLESDEPYDLYTGLHFLIVRDRLTRTYTYIMGSLPLLLAVVFGHMLLFNANARQQPMHFYMLDAVAGMLAVLPLRAILVPAGIESLLRLDFLLGMGLSLFVAIVLWRYSQEIWPAKR